MKVASFRLSWITVILLFIRSVFAIDIDEALPQAIASADAIGALENLPTHLPDPRNITSDLLPPLWTEVPSLTRLNFRTDTDGAFIVDVFDYKERMSLYKYLIENVQHCEWKIKLPSSYISPVPSFDPGNILWGLPLQHGWQFSSGRLLTEADRCIQFIIILMSLDCSK